MHPEQTIIINIIKIHLISSDKEKIFYLSN